MAGGKFANPSEANKEDMQNCPLTNRPCESSIGKVDKEVIQRPNIALGYAETKLVFKRSGVIEHLDETSVDETSEDK